MARILVVEDQIRFGKLLEEHLRDAGYAADLATTASEFREMASLDEYALYLVDLGLPDGDGLELIADLRAAKRKTPILVATGRAGINDRISGLDCGADDYVVKPFHHAELLARVRALLRRPSELTQASLMAGKLILDTRSGQVICNGTRLELRPSEQRLLSLLIERAGRVVLRSTIDNTLRADEALTPNAVEQAISRLRKALSERPTGIQIRTVRGFGYTLETGDVIGT